MRHWLLILFGLTILPITGQSITVDSQTYTPQQLVEDILINSSCIQNVQVTNVVGGDFGGSDQSFGYFDATGTTFPFQNGIVLSTGRLNNVPGPNTTLSDDDASGWIGDSDLETILNESNTLNATILEFDFTAVAPEISFRYLFASEEYQEGNSNSCQFSDLFGFLIRPDGQNQYENIALVPDTNTPVKVTTVTPGISGSCPPQNETYFGMYNGSTSPINFNGQTAILTATASVVPNELYHVKLVIADETNPRYDSAVFLEGGSFQLATDLGPNRLLATANPICEGNTYELDARLPGQNSYNWYRDGVLVQSDPSNCLNCGIYTVTQEGTYTVEVGLADNCTAYGEVVIEYAENPIVFNSILTECDIDQDGLTIYNLFDATDDLTGNNPNLVVANFYLNETDAISDANEISTFSSFENTIPNQIMYARILNQANCFEIAELQLTISNAQIDIPDLEACDEGDVDGFTTFDLSSIQLTIEEQIPDDAVLSFYLSEDDAFYEMNALLLSFQNTIVDFQTLFVRINSNSQCYAISEVNLIVLYTPELLDDDTVFYCENTDSIRLIGGVLNDSPSNYYYQWNFNGNPTPITTSFYDANETGVYEVFITDPNGCSNSRNITVLASEIAEITAVSVDGIGTNNSVTISVSGTGDYEYALDNPNGSYQDENVFINVNPGFHTIYVRDKNGCGIAEQLISVLGFPKYFTPNGDGNHDLWQAVGVNFEQFPNLTITIYDRYGKLLKTLNQSNTSWDGSYNGAILPNSDYWFTATLGDGRSYSNHFSLKR